MELNVTISAVALLVIALASIAGGLVLYRDSRRIGWKAVGMSAVALGVGVLLVFTLNSPVSTEGDPAEPLVGRAPIPAQSTQPSTTRQQPSGPIPTGSMLAPNQRMTFEDVEYTGVGTLDAASLTGPIVCCGTPINIDDMEVAGTGTNHSDGDAGVEV